MEAEEATRFRAVAFRLSNLSQNKADSAIPTMRVCAKMANPTRVDMVALKPIRRYVLHRPCAPCVYGWQRPNPAVVACLDSDWAGDKQTRKSVTGGAIFVWYSMYLGTFVYF